MTDEQLACRAKEADHAAFEELVRRYQDRLLSFLHYRIGQAAAEDVFQEVCIRWWTKMNAYQPTGSFAAWAFTIARHALIDSVRKEKLRAHLPLEGRAEAVADPEPGPSAAAESNESRRLLQEALAQLSEEQREVFLLREYGGLSFKEIAAVQGCPLNTALARMRYALIKLRGELEACHG